VLLKHINLSLDKTLVYLLCANRNEKLFEMYAHFETVRKSDSSFIAIEKVNT
jgi:hypothetical protein